MDVLNSRLAAVAAVVTILLAGVWIAQTLDSRPDNTASSNSEIASAEPSAAASSTPSSAATAPTSDSSQPGRGQITEPPSDQEPSEEEATAPLGNELLADLDPVIEGGWDYTQALDIDGTVYTTAIESSSLGFCGSNAPDVEDTVEYSIGRDYERLEAVAGMSEQSASDLPINLAIFGDGREIWMESLAVGRAEDVSIDVAGVLRLEIVATVDFADPGGCQYVYAALGEPTLLN